MKSVTVVGSGNAFNTDGRAHACYLLENSSEEMLLLDCGATSLFRLQQLRAPIDRIDWLLLTHFHGDHFIGLPFLLIEFELIRHRKRPFEIAGPVGVERRCRELMELAYPGFYPKLHFEIRYKEIEQRTDLGNFVVEPFPITHLPESTGYRIAGPSGKSFAFSGDSAWDEQLFALMADVDLGIIELSMFEQTNPPTAHVSLTELRQGRLRLGARRLVLSHIYNELASAATELGLGEVAHDGLVLTI